MLDQAKEIWIYVEYREVGKWLWTKTQQPAKQSARRAKMAARAAYSGGILALNGRDGACERGLPCLVAISTDAGGCCDTSTGEHEGRRAW
jgi:hypothetical protein